MHMNDDDDEGLVQFDDEDIVVWWWRDAIPDLAKRAYEIIGMTKPMTRDADIESIMAILGYNALTSLDDRRGEYDYAAALVDLDILEQAVKKLKGRVLVAKHNSLAGNESNIANEKASVVVTQKPKPTVIEI